MQTFHRVRLQPAGAKRAARRFRPTWRESPAARPTPRRACLPMRISGRAQAGPTTDTPLESRWQRAPHAWGAAMLDAIFALVFCYGPAVALVAIGEQQQNEGLENLGVGLMLIGLAITLAIQITMLCRSGQTVGKMMVGFVSFAMTTTAIRALSARCCCVPLCRGSSAHPLPGADVQPGGYSRHFRRRAALHTRFHGRHEGRRSLSRSPRIGPQWTRISRLNCSSS